MKILFFILLFLPTIVFSQDVVMEVSHYFLSEGDTLILSNGGHLRETPSQNGKSIDQLPIGTVLYCNAKIEFEGVGEAFTYKNLKSKYYPVQYKKDGQIKSGYVWGGLIARTYSVDKNNNRYIFGQRSFDETTNETTVAVIRIDGQTNKIYEQFFSYDFGYRTWYESKILSNMGLSNLEQIFRVGIPGEACGVYTTYHYYGWNGEKFIELPTKNSMVDAGVFSFYENMLFPTEHKLGNNLIIVESVTTTTDYAEYSEIEGEIIETEEITKEKKVYLWNGKTARLLKPKK